MSFTLCLMKEFNSSFLNDMVKEADGVQDHVIIAHQILVVPFNCTGRHILGMASVLARVMVPRKLTYVQNTF